MLRRVDGHALRRQLELKAEGQSKKWMSKRSCEKLIDRESMEVGLSRQDALCRSKWIVGVDLNATRLRIICPPSLDDNPSGF